jgi:citrate lyase subunit beta/citryl-CoA lyase
VPLLPLIESAAGFDQLRAIASVRGVQRLAFGAIDFQLDMRMRASFDELIYFRSQLVLVSRLAGIASPIDSPSVAIEDAAEVELDAQRARRLGFGAKLCIHPRQLAAVNRSFSPSEAELAWARRVLAIAASSGGAAVTLDGRMIDKPVILRAQAILAEAETARSVDAVA